MKCYLVQLDWLEGLQSGSALVFLPLLPNSKTRPVLDLSSKKLFFFNFPEKLKTELARPKMVFLAILAKNRLFSDNSDTLANSRITSVKLVCDCKL